MLSDGGQQGVKPLVWMGGALAGLRDFPQPVREKVGSAWYQAQLGDKHVNLKPLNGFGSGVLEVVSDYRSDTFRAVCTVRLAGKIYVHHVFQKKSKAGISTPKSEIELIRRRPKRAMELPASVENQK